MPRTVATQLMFEGRAEEARGIGMRCFEVEPDPRDRVRLLLEVRKGGAVELQTVFVLDEGGTVLSAGQKHGDGILILGVSCSTH